MGLDEVGPRCGRIGDMDAAAEVVEGDRLAGVEAGGFASAAQGDGALADDLGGVGVEVDHDAGVLVDAEDEASLRQFGLEHREASLAQVAEARVVVAALGVVVVRDDGDVEADLGEHVEALEPVRVGAHLVHLVDRDGDLAQRQRRGGREDDGATRTKLLGDRIGDRRVPPLCECVRRTAGPGEHPVRGSDLRDAALDGNGVAGVGSGQAGRLDPSTDRVVEVLDRLGCEDRGVLLEPERCVEQDRPRVGAEPVEDRAVRPFHRRRRLAGAHDGEDPRQRHRVSFVGAGEDRPAVAGKNVGSVTARCSRSPTASGCCACTSW